MKTEDSILREMRDQVYGQRSTDSNWDGCEDRWIADTHWLHAQYDKLPRPLPPHDSLPFPKNV